MRQDQKDFLEELDRIQMKQLSDEELRRMGKDPNQVRSYVPGDVTRDRKARKFVLRFFIVIWLVAGIGMWIQEGDSSTLLFPLELFKEIWAALNS